MMMGCRVNKTFGSALFSLSLTHTHKATFDHKHNNTNTNKQVQVAKTAGLIIIGDEILKGKTSDTNSLYAARRLRENGACLSTCLPACLPSCVCVHTLSLTSADGALAALCPDLTALLAVG